MRDIGLTINDINEVRSYLENVEGLDKAMVYGSRAKGSYKEFSDVDVVLFGEELTGSQIAKLEERLYYSYLPYKFDISVFNELKNDNLKEHIRRVGVEIYRRQ